MSGYSFEVWLKSGLGLLIVGAVGYVMRFLTERSHAREMEALRASNARELEAARSVYAGELEGVRSRYSHELEHLRSQLGQRAIQFSKLHQDRVEEVIKTYDALFELRSELHAYLLVVQHGASANKSQAREDAYNKLYDIVKKAWLSYLKRRFYFDTSMTETIEAVFKPFYDIEQITFGWHQSDVTAFDPGYDKDTRDRFVADLKEAQEIKRKTLPEAITALEDSMRGMLGVTP